MKTYQLIDTSSYCNLHTKASISAKWAEKNEKDRKSPPFCRECRAYHINNLSSFFIRESLFLSGPSRVLSSQSPQSLFLHKLLGSSELVSHHAQELLALLKYIQVNQRNLHQRII